MPRLEASRYRMSNSCRVNSHELAAHPRLPPVRIERHVSGGHGPRFAPIGSRQLSGRAPDNGRYSRHELAHAKRLGQVVVGAAFESDHLVRLRVARRQHQHTRSLVRSAGPDRAANGDAIHAGKHDVQDHQVESIGPHQVQRRAPIRDLLGLEPRQRQMESDDFPERCLIFDDQRAARGFPWCDHSGHYRSILSTSSRNHGAAEWSSRRGLRSRSCDWRRRHGGRLSRARSEAGPRRRAQGAQRSRR
jgi:hypothetical protein